MFGTNCIDQIHPRVGTLLETQGVDDAAMGVVLILILTPQLLDAALDLNSTRYFLSHLAYGQALAAPDADDPEHSQPIRRCATSLPLAPDRSEPDNTPSEQVPLPAKTRGDMKF